MLTLSPRAVRFRAAPRRTAADAAHDVLSRSPIALRDGRPPPWLVFTLFAYPYVYLSVRAALGGIDPSLEDAAYGQAAGPALILIVIATVPMLILACGEPPQERSS